MSAYPSDVIWNTPNNKSIYNGPARRPARPHALLFLLAVACCLLPVASPSAQAANWYVNDAVYNAGDSFTAAVGNNANVGSATAPYLTITKALQSAAMGDTIYVDAGTFGETVVIDTNNITIVGRDSNATVIDPPGVNTTAGLYGIYADTQVGLTIKNIGVTGAYDGILFDNVDNSTVSGDSAGACGNSGIYLRAGSDTNTISGNTANSNTIYGINLDASSNNTVSNNTANSNLSEGINLTSSSNNTVSGNTANSNSGTGFYLTSSSNNKVISNAASSNSFYGILLSTSSDNNTVTANTAGLNSQYGIFLSSSANNTVLQNTLNSNTQYQIYISGTSSSDTVQKNNIKTSGTNPDSAVYNGSTDATAKFTFTRNWWGTTDEAKIKKMIYQVSNSDSIAWNPYRLGVVDTAAGADTTAPAAPSTFSVSLSAPAGGPLTISWTNPTTNEETNGGAVGFNGAAIYRLTNLVDTTHWGNAANEVHVGTPTETTWTDTNVVGGSTYYYRLTSHDSALFENESFFNDTNSYTVPSAGPPGAKTWYVNDTGVSGDSFTYSIGYDTAAGDSPNLPVRTIMKALTLAKAGDTIKIDAGMYAETVVIDTNDIVLIGKDSSASVIDPPGSNATAGLYGIYADTQSGITVKALGVTGAYVGIFFSNVSLSTITSDSAGSNGSHGIHVDKVSETNTITDNTANSNSNEGIRIESSSGNTIANNTVNSNSVNGIDVVTAASRNTVSGNTANSNSGIGIRIFGTGSDNKVTNNIANSNTTYGIYLTSNTKNNIVRDNLVKNNVQTGLGINGSDTNAVYQNDISGNDTGILIAGSSRGNTIFKNNITGNDVNNVYNSGGLAQKALTPNWWGTANEDAITAKFSDTANTFRPYRLGVVDTALGVDTTAPGLVTGVTLDTTVAGQIKITWTLPVINEETNGGAVGFNGANIWRLVNTPDTTHWSNTSLRVKSTISTETSWTDTAVSNGSTYYYRITSKDAAASFNESFFTDTKATKPTDLNPAGILAVKFFGGAGLAPDVSPGETLVLEILDTGANTNTAAAETVTVRLKNLATLEQETATLNEADTDDAVFKVNFRFSGNSIDSASGGGRLYVLAGDTVQFDYTDPGDANDTEQKILKVISVLELKVLAGPDTKVKQGDTRAVLAFKIMNDNPVDNASPTDTVTGIRITRLLGADGHLVSNGVKLWFDTGAIGVFSETVDILDFSVSIGAGQANLTPNSARQVFNPGDTRHFIVTFEVADSSAIVGDSIDAKIAVGDVTHSLGGNVPDTDVNSPGALAITGSLPNVLIQAAPDITVTPGFYGGPSGDTIPGATLTYVIRYDNDGGETSVNFILNAKIPANTMLGRGADSPSASALLSPHTGAAATVTITDDSGTVVADTDPNAQRIRWTFSTGVAPNNGDASGTVDASTADVDAGFVKYKVYIK